MRKCIHKYKDLLEENKIVPHISLDTMATKPYLWPPRGKTVRTGAFINLEVHKKENNLFHEV